MHAFVFHPRGSATHSPPPPDFILTPRGRLSLSLSDQFSHLTEWMRRARSLSNCFGWWIVFWGSGIEAAKRCLQPFPGITLGTGFSIAKPSTPPGEGSHSKLVSTSSGLPSPQTLFRPVKSSEQLIRDARDDTQKGNHSWLMRNHRRFYGNPLARMSKPTLMRSWFSRSPAAHANRE